MTIRVKALWAVGASALATVLVAGYWYYSKRLPRFQIAGQSVGYVWNALSAYADATGQLPSNLDDLINKAVVKRDNKYQSTFADLIRDGHIRPPQSGQLVLISVDRPILAFDDVEVAWSLRTSDLTRRDDTLVSAATGEPVYLVRSKCQYFLLNDDDRSMQLSVELYEKLLEKSRMK